MTTDFTSYSEHDTRKFGHDFAATLTGGNTVLLDGDLGAGKTVFVRGVCDAFGISGVRSPSFTLINEYHSPCGICVVHADLYRLDSDGANEIGLEDYAGNIDTILLVEWPQRWLNPPRNSITVHFTSSSEYQRSITVERSNS